MRRSNKRNCWFGGTARLRSFWKKTSSMGGSLSAMTTWKLRRFVSSNQNLGGSSASGSETDFKIYKMP
jgi:hypothetical protein